MECVKTDTETLVKLDAAFANRLFDALEYQYKTENLIEKLIEKLGIAECRNCKFGGTYCADCKFIDAHAILDALDDICTDNKSHHLVSQNDTKR